MPRYGSLINHLMDDSASPEPRVDMGATLLMWSDRHAYTIVRVSGSGKTFWMQQDIATRTDKNGLSDMQSYTFEFNPRAPVVRVSKRRDGRWATTGGRGNTVIVGSRSEYHDYSF